MNAEYLLKTTWYRAVKCRKTIFKKSGTAAKSLLTFLFIILTTHAFSQNNLTQKLEAYMKGQNAVNQFSGTVMVTRNDTLLFQKAYGFADYEWQVPNTIDTKFGMASITKQFTAISILQLVERGQLKFEDRLSNFFPDFPNGDSITVHMLLTHTSGLALDFEELYLYQTSLTKDSALTYIKTLPLQFKPGKNLAYSNVAYFLLSQIIEKTSGLSFGDYLQKNIFDILGMKNSGLNSNEKIVPKLARSYYREGEGFFKNPYINWEVNIGLDGMYSTAADLYLLDRALYGNSLLSASSKAKMFTQYNKAFSDNGFLDSYGYGIFINPYFNHGHEMLTHSGGYFGVMTTMDRYPEDNIFITVLSNNQSESHWIAYGLAGIMFGKDVELPYIHVQKSIDPALLSRYAGKYGSFEIIAKNDKLYLNTMNVELIPESDRKFFRKDNPDRTFEFLYNKKTGKRSMILTKGGVRETIQGAKVQKKSYRL